MLVTTLVVLIVVILSGTYYLRQVDRVQFYARYHQEIQSIKKVSNILFFFKTLQPSKLEQYDLTIDQKDLDFLNHNLPPGYVGNTLSDQYKKPVKAKLTVGSTEYDVEVRYRGDTDAHWRDSQKSWLVKIKGGDMVNGMRSFHLIIPVDRFYLLEDLNMYRAKKMGLDAIQSSFLNLFINGKREGVYWQIEDFGIDLMNRMNIELPVNLYESKEFAELDPSIKDPFTNIEAWKQLITDPNTGRDSTTLEKLIELVNNPDDAYFYQHIVDLVDMENFYNWQINQALVNSTHQSGINMRLYVDHKTQKFKFIPWDVSYGETPIDSTEQAYNTLVTRILKNPEFLKERNKRLWNYVSDPKNLEDDLQHYDELDAATEIDFYKDNNKVESNLAYRKKITSIRQLIIDKIDYWKSNLEHQPH